jgi:hypothetical protein
MKTKPSLTKLLFICSLLSIQDLFGQNSKMIENNALQITLLGTYENYLSKGLSIARNGLELSHSLKNNELNLHSLFYHSLSQVNPNVSKYPSVQNCISLYNKMKSLQTAIKNTVSETDLLAASEKQYAGNIVTNIMSETEKDMQELDNLLTDGKYQLSDDERIIRMDAVNSRVLEKYKALDGLCKSIHTVISGRKAQRDHAKELRKLYGLP